MILKTIKNQVNLLKSPEKAKQAMRFFKTGPGQYGQGDIFVGLTNPQCRTIANNNKNIDLNQLQELLTSPIHQERLIALVILDHKYKNKKTDERQAIFKLYIKRIQFVNNWDLVDLSAPNIVGKYILQNCVGFSEIKRNKDLRKMLYQWVKNPNLWLRRISIISTFTFIRSNQFQDTLRLSEALLNDKQDLIHKAVGWMLRQVGKRSFDKLSQFILHNYSKMPRTTLRYAIEKCDQQTRKEILKGNLSVLIKQ